MTTDNFEVKLEQMIDKLGLSYTLDVIAAICSEKAEHIRVHCQDVVTAKTWLHDAKLLCKAARAVKTL